MTAVPTHIVTIEAHHATIGRCQQCGQMIYACGLEAFAQRVAEHQADEAEAELEASRARHPSSQPLEPNSTPWLNRSHG